MLIGNDHYGDILLPNRIELQPGLYLLNSHLGWIVSGRLPQVPSEPFPAAPSLLIMQAPHHFLAPSGHPGALNKPQLERFWDLETIGINDSPHQSDDHAASTLFHESVRHIDGYYEVGWPWKPGYELPNNYQLAKGRLATLLLRLRRQPDRLRQYDHVLQQQLSFGIVEVVSPPATGLSHRLHYLPHHPVLSPGSATTKLRIV